MQFSKTSRAGVLAALTLLAFAASNVSRAQPSAPAQQDKLKLDQARTVDDLLQLETKMLVEKNKPLPPPSAPVTARVEKAVDVVEVDGIWGVDDAKKALVRVNGSVYNVGVGGVAGAYIVRQIGGGCVRLAKPELMAEVPASKGSRSRRSTSAHQTRGVDTETARPVEIRSACFRDMGNAAMRYAGAQPSRVPAAGGPVPLPIVPATVQPAQVVQQSISLPPPAAPR